MGSIHVNGENPRSCRARLVWPTPHGGLRPGCCSAGQGNPWDTPWDMACALMGGILALRTLGRLHDRQMEA